MNLRMMICREGTQDCCNIDPMCPDVCVGAFKPNQIDVIDKDNLKECENWLVFHITYMELGQMDPTYSFIYEKNKAWQGKYVEVVFHNNSRYHCEVDHLGFFLGKTLPLKESCTLI